MTLSLYFTSNRRIIRFFDNLNARHKWRTLAPLEAVKITSEGKAKIHLNRTTKPAHLHPFVIHNCRNVFDKSVYVVYKYTHV